MFPVRMHDVVTGCGMAGAAGATETLTGGGALMRADCNCVRQVM
jgi:hypothetical protein